MNRETMEEIKEVPEWVKDAVIYTIYPDRFATSRQLINKEDYEKEDNRLKLRSKYGGTIKGITENLDYLLKLGINCVYINSIFASCNEENMTDYYHVDPCLGTKEEFKFMVDMCHNCSIKVILGASFQQLGPNNDKEKQELNTSEAEEIAYYKEVCQHWLREYDIDGWGIEAVGELCNDFIEKLYRSAKSIKQECILISKTGEGLDLFLGQGHLNKVTENNFYKKCKEFFALETMDAHQLEIQIASLKDKRTLHNNINYLNSKDTRFLNLCSGDIKKLKLAILFQMTINGTPLILYGDEQQVTRSEYEFPEPMSWDEETENEMFAFYKAAIFLRKKLYALRRGDTETLVAEEDTRVFVYKRYTQEQQIIVALNAGSEPQKLEISLEDQQIIWQSGFQSNRLEGHSYLIAGRITVPNEIG